MVHQLDSTDGKSGSSDSSALIQTHNSLLSGINWSVESDLFLADFVERYSLPHLALITRGQYMNVGAPNVANPNLKPYVLIYSRQKLRKVLAQVMKHKGEGRRAVLTDQKVAIPEDYDGFFEILSEDGKPVKGIETVQELTKKFPEMCLVRQSCKAYVPDQDGELRSLFKTRTLEDGERLTLVGQFNFKRIAFLRCFDDSGDSVYLKMTSKGKFSPIAHKDAITGVHYIRNLLDAKRFPLTVRLIQGSYPPELRPSGGGPVILRLSNTIHADIVMVYALHREWEFLTVPLNAYLKVAPSSNHPQIICRNEFRHLCARCEEILPHFLNQIAPFNDQQLSTGITVTSDDSAIQVTQIVIDDDVKCSSSSQSSSPQGVITDDEIDQLYDYIRGLAPLPTSCRQDTNKPPPPPLETLPSRKSGDSRPSTSSPTVHEYAKTRHHSAENKRAEKRLDEVVYGESAKLRKDRQKLSKSTDKLVHHSEPQKQTSHPHVYQGNALIAPQGGRKPRPLSMVLPDSLKLLPPAEYYGHYGQPPSHHVTNYASQVLYPSVTNLHICDDKSAQEFMNPYQSSQQIGYPPGPPPPYLPYPPLRAPNMYQRYPMQY